MVTISMSGRFFTKSVTKCDASLGNIDRRDHSVEVPRCNDRWSGALARFGSLGLSICRVNPTTNTMIGWYN